jgi:hypothetical protein
MDNQEIIDKKLKPILPYECQKLGMPESFIKGIYSMWRSSFCEAITNDNGNVISVRIRIRYDITRPCSAYRDFIHELWHAKNYYIGKKSSSDLVAELYAWRRYLEKSILHR